MAALSTVFLGFLLYFCGAGIDFTDESYYLLFIANPRDYGFTTTQFGYLYAPLYRLAGGDISLLRIANAMSLAGASLLFFHLAISKASHLPTLTSLLLSAGASASSATFYTLWIPTPGYNSLNLGLCRLG
jgi:hypothetical protein